MQHFHTSDQRDLHVQCYKSGVAQFATLVECSNELSAHLTVQHLDVALPSVLTTR